MRNKGAQKKRDSKLKYKKWKSSTRNEGSPQEMRKI